MRCGLLDPVRLTIVVGDAADHAYRPGTAGGAAATCSDGAKQLKLWTYPILHCHGASLWRKGSTPLRHWLQQPVFLLSVMGLGSADHGSCGVPSRYRGRRISYDELARSAAEFDPLEYTQFPGVCPSWDNEARKPGCGLSFVRSTPARYGAWLDNSCRKMLRRPNPDERLVFINAWNEWAEGAHLRPDRHFGYAYLNETARILSGLTSASPYKNMPSIKLVKRQSAIKQWFRKAARKGATFFERFAMFLRSI